VRACVRERVYLYIVDLRDVCVCLRQRSARFCPRSNNRNLHVCTPFCACFCVYVCVLSGSGSGSGSVSVSLSLYVCVYVCVNVHLCAYIYAGVNKCISLKTALYFRQRAQLLCQRATYLYNSALYTGGSRNQRGHD